MSYRTTPSFAIGALELEPSADVAAKLLGDLRIRTERDREILLEHALQRGRRFAISPPQLQTAADQSAGLFRLTVTQKFFPLGPGERPPPGWDVIG